MPLSSTMLFTQGLSGGTMTLGGGIGSLSTLSSSFGSNFNSASLKKDRPQVKIQNFFFLTIFALNI